MTIFDHVSFLRNRAEDERRAGNDELSVKFDKCADEIESLRQQFLDGVTTILGKVKENNRIIKDAEARLDRAGL